MELELLDYQTANNTKLPRREYDDNQRCRWIDQYLLEVLLIKDAATETVRFLNLIKIGKISYYYST